MIMSTRRGRLACAPFFAAMMLTLSVGSALAHGGQGGEGQVEGDGQFHGHDGRPVNAVVVVNHSDGRYRGDGAVDYNTIFGNSVNPLNEARAEASCTDCQTFAIALQIDLYQRGSSYVAPENYAIAINTNCTRCVTVAWAIQYVIPVADPSRVPERVRELASDLDSTLRYVMRQRDLSTVDRIGQINSVINQFNDLAQYLLTSRDVEEGRNTES
jgi:hypothetical protein